MIREDLIARHFQQQIVVQAVELLIGFQHLGLDLFQQVARGAGGALLFADQDAPFEIGEADFIELVEVVGVNAQKTHTFNQGIALICGFLQHAFIKG